MQNNSAPNTLNREQKKVVAEVDRRLAKAGLVTYSAMEDSHFKALVFAHEAMDLSKRLITQMKQDSDKIKNAVAQASPGITKTAQEEN